MVVASASFFPETFTADLDDMLLQICEELQLSTARYDQAVDRYNAVGALLESAASPFRQFHPEIYPQGSMALNTTVKPIIGPHDLDFVLELSLSHWSVNPMSLIRTLYDFLKAHGVYGPMTSLKNRCVRIEYENEFFMDVLPSCRNSGGGGTCIKVPDRSTKGWADSNPRGYIQWFQKRTRVLLIDRVLDRASPVPPQQAVAEKATLQLVVQLLKRWRDYRYRGNDRKLAPISIVLTTLAADVYKGERSVSQGLSSVLSGIAQLIGASRRNGEGYLKVLNPSSRAEDLSERWASDRAAYESFEASILEFGRRWSQVMNRNVSTYAELEALFGEPVASVLRKRGDRVQRSRLNGQLGVTPTGIITSAARAVVTAKPNTFHGEE